MSGLDQSRDLPARALDEAEAWFARHLAGAGDDRADVDPSDFDPAEFERWLSASPDHVAAWERTCALWEQVGEMVEQGGLDDFADEALRAAEPSMKADRTRRAVRAGRGPVRRRLRRFLVAAMVAGLLLAVGLAGVGSYWPRTYVAASGSREVRLPDGSRVQLDVGARLAVDTGWWHRNVRLLQGRAVFDVVHNAWRPFVVDAGAGRVTVLGTRFQVDREHDTLAVTLVRGSVRIDTPEDRLQLRLQPDEQARWSASTGHWTQAKVDAQAVTSWTEGFLTFRGTPLAQAVAEINRTSQRKIRLADPSLGKLELSGSFHRGDASGVADVLPYVLPVKVRTEGNDIIVSRR